MPDKPRTGDDKQYSVGITSEASREMLAADKDS